VKYIKKIIKISFIFIIVLVVLFILISCRTNPYTGSIKNKNKNLEDSKYENDTIFKDRWNKKDLRLGSILKTNSQYVLYYAGADNYYKYSVGVSFSKDLINWEDYEFNPVIKSNNIKWEFNGIFEPAVIIKDNNYFMWYPSANGGKEHIGLATSKDGINWQKYDKNPVISPEFNDGWESSGIDEPAVIYEDNKFFMWYTGMDNNRNYAIGLATSNDGINWQKYDKNPVLRCRIKNNFDQFGVMDPTVFFKNGEFVMLYVGYNSPQGGESYINLATSKDGINWQKYDNNPVMTPYDINNQWEAGGLIEPILILDNNKIYCLYSGISKLSDGRKVQTGLSISKDFKSWEKIGITSLKNTQNDWWY